MRSVIMMILRAFLLQAYVKGFGMESTSLRGPSFARLRAAVTPTQARRHIQMMSMKDRSTYSSEKGRMSRKSVPGLWKKKIDELRHQEFASKSWQKKVDALTVGALAVAMALFPNAALAANEDRFTIVDKTGPIGAIATVVENGIDKAHDTFQSAGITENTYGFSIILFTVLIRTLLFPLTRLQVESSSSMSKLAPVTKKINAAKLSKQETQILTGQLYQAAKVNPLAGCFPALVQFPVFISLYRSLSNLVAEGKLSEPFLWLPSLEGPIYGKASLDWFTSIFTLNPKLGWEDTLRFLSLPLILIVTQSTTSKLLQPPRDPNAASSEQDQLAQNLVTFLPFIVAFFSLNVPAGLSIYWISSNIIASSITLLIRGGIQKEDVMKLPEVQKVMENMAKMDMSGFPLVEAAKLGDLRGVEKQLAEGRNPNEADREGRSAMHFASGYGSVPCVTALVRAGANMDILDQGGSSPMHYAAGYGRKEVLQLLLDGGASVQLNTAGMSPADCAASNPGEMVAPVREDAALMAALTVQGSKGPINETQAAVKSGKGSDMPSPMGRTAPNKQKGAQAESSVTEKGLDLAKEKDVDLAKEQTTGSAINEDMKAKEKSKKRAAMGDRIQQAYHKQVKATAADAENTASVKEAGANPEKVGSSSGGREMA